MPTVDDISAYLRGKGGISENVIKEEAAYLAGHYGDDALKAAEGAVDDYRYRSQGRENAPSSGSEEAKDLYREDPWRGEEPGQTRTAAPPPPGPFTPPQSATAPQAYDTSSVANYLQQLYQNFLGRTPSAEETRDHIQRLGNASNQQWTQQLLDTFMSSPEYQQSQPQKVVDLYQKHLGRAPSNEEIQSHAGNPHGITGIEYAVLSSPEYQARPKPQPAATAPPAPTPPPVQPPPVPPPAPRTGPFPAPFDDPASRFVTDVASRRFDQRMNPAAGSGTALFETFAKEFATLLQGEPFTDSQEAALRTKAFEQVEQLRRNEIEQKKTDLMRRRISQNSGIWISEMNRIDDKYDRMRAQSENELLVTAIGERQRRLTQALGVLGNLAASEEGRMDAALALSMIPLQLQDQAFQRLMMASNMGGDLSGVTNSLMGLLNMATNSRLYNEQQQSNALTALGQYFGQYMLG